MAAIGKADRASISEAQTTVTKAANGAHFEVETSRLAWHGSTGTRRGYEGGSAVEDLARRPEFCQPFLATAARRRE